jgi:hypothetical protein
VRLFLFITLVLSTLPLAKVHAASEGKAALQQVLNTNQSEAKRLEALHALEKMGGIDVQQITRSICDTSPTIRAEMLRLGTALATTDPELELRLIALANDRTPIVQKQILKSLPQFPSARAAAAFEKVLATALKSKDSGVRSLAESLRK